MSVVSAHSDAANAMSSLTAYEGERIRNFTIVTTVPNELCAELHNRMPVVLKPDVWPVWLGEEPADVPQLKALVARTTMPASSSRSPHRDHSGAMRSAIRSMERSTIHPISCSGDDRVPPKFGRPFWKPRPPPPGFLFWRAASRCLYARLMRRRPRGADGH